MLSTCHLFYILLICRMSPRAELSSWRHSLPSLPNWSEIVAMGRAELKVQMHHPRRRSRLTALAVFITTAVYIVFWWHTDTLSSQPWKPDSDSILFGQRPLNPSVGGHSKLPFIAPLRTKGRDVVDSEGQVFKLVSVNWYGGSDEHFVPGGLEVQNRSKIARNIRRMGFNSVRLPYADEMVVTNPYITEDHLAANPDLIGLRALDVFAAVVEAMTDAGLAVILNNHITTSKWCCGPDLCNGLWYNDNIPGSTCQLKQTEEDWIRNWETVMKPHVNNTLVIGADLRNEVRALWGTLSWDRWAQAAELAGNRLLKLNPNWLIIVGGLGSNNFLTEVKERPVDLLISNRVVYTSHVYGWSGWGSLGGSYAKRTYESFAKSMHENWGYLLEEDIAPVWVGEFGAPDSPNIGDANYWNNLMRYLKESDAGFAYWAANPRKAKDYERESYALLQDDWDTPVLDYRLRDMQKLL
jgi:endoglucanase